jgi:tetratricopeptide (TPR) repeat protein
VALDPDRLAVPGIIAMNEGRYAEAIPALQAARVANQCALCYLPEISEAFGKLGQQDSARFYYEKFIANGSLYRVFVDAPYKANVYQRLGELAEQRGDKKAAVEYYEKLIDLWKNADPELQPIVKDARARVTRLTSEH